MLLRAKPKTPCSVTRLKDDLCSHIYSCYVFFDSIFILSILLSYRIFGNTPSVGEYLIAKSSTRLDLYNRRSDYFFQSFNVVNAIVVLSVNYTFAIHSHSKVNASEREAGDGRNANDTFNVHADSYFGARPPVQT